MHDKDLALMRRAFVEASKRSRLDVHPNPRVGAALLTREGRELAAFHNKAGEDHAERALLKAAKAAGLNVRGATLAVTLEPCCHTGRTPPCTEVIFESQIARVLVGCRDPFPKVDGQGIEILREHGIEVIEDLMKDECEALNEDWLFAQRKRRPFVSMKMATSLDGLWTAQDGKSQWITGPSARSRGHQLRAQADALITGAGTVRADNPSFTARSAEGLLLSQQPEVYVLSKERPLDFSGYRLESHPRLVRSVAPTDLGSFLESLFQEKQVHRVLIEAGAELSSAFLQQALVDEIALFMGPRFLGGQGQRIAALKAGSLPGLEVELVEHLSMPEGDLFLRFKCKG